jgi:hypothetical protein
MRTWTWLLAALLVAMVCPHDARAQASAPAAAAPKAAAPAQPAPAAQPATPAQPVAPAQPACVPGQQIECACGAGLLGVQQCVDDGTRFAPCVCQAGQPPADVPPPIAPAPPPYPAYQPYGGQPNYAIPEHQQGELRPMRRRSKGVMIAGIVLLSVGAAMAIPGAAMLIVGTCAGEEEQRSGSFTIDTCDENDEMIRAGAVMTGVGGAMLLAGVIMTPIGASKVPDDSVEAASLEIVASPTFTGLRGSF